MKVKAVIFDLDGTLTEPYLDFDQIRAEMGNITGPIWEAMQVMSPQERKRAEDILHRHEIDAAENSTLNPGAAELVHQLRRENRAIGIVTRNRRDSVDRICRIHDLKFDTVITREDGPVKPDPFPVLHACKTVNVSPQETLVVGDYLFDLQSGRRAGAASVLICTSKNYRDFVDHADYVIHTLNELTGIIQRIEGNDIDTN